MENLPCWLNREDCEVAAALLALDWIWLENEEPENFEDQTWEYKLTKVQGWQFWGVPGEMCLLASRRGAVFGLSLEGDHQKNFKRELQKARKAIKLTSQRQAQERPRQLSLGI